MKRLLPLAIAALCLANPAWAALQVYSHVGVWDVFSGTDTNGQQTCGIGHTNPTDGSAFSLRFALGANDVTFVAAKPGWHIPPSARVPVVMQIGLNAPWTEQAVGHDDRLEWPMDRASVPVFDSQFRRAQTMTVTFPAGSEQPWVISLQGSTAASDAMGRCVTAMMQNPATAAPAAPAAAAPAAPAGPTQPFSASPPAEPAPAQPATPGQPMAPAQPTR